MKEMMGISTDSNTKTTPSRGGQGGQDLVYAGRDNMNELSKAQWMKTELDRQEKEVDELLARVSNDLEYFRSIPNQWPVNGEITSCYGWRASPFGGRSESFHNGIDIANNVGCDIVAAADGTVTQAGWVQAYGRTVTIDHGYGFKTMYGHNYRLLVKEGQQVKKGDIIAVLGSSGRSTGPHLHFTIYKDDTALDPMLFLPE
ncbi:putative peptidase [hydrocarbon metagenome]|uniref:Putative peptidase n=1 Tax=hydrocarbon metagenome TaxID=938273 RepID=A0A0W8E6W9_9ZZZZ